MRAAQDSAPAPYPGYTPNCTPTGVVRHPYRSSVLLVPKLQVAMQFRFAL